jgi:CRP-like cAMP-binding protein
MNTSSASHKKQLIEPYYNISCLSCPIKDCSVLKHCSDKCLERISELKRIVGFFKGQRILMEGNPSRGVYFILQGKVKLYKSDAKGREVIIRFAKPGDMVGFSVSSDQPENEVSATAMEDTLLCHVSHDAFIELLHSDAKLAYEMLRFYRGELHKTEMRSLKLATMTVQEKVVDALITIYEAYGAEGKQRTLCLELSRQDIANLAGTTKEQVSKVLTELKVKGLIDTNGKKIDLVNLSALMQMAGWA